MFRKWLLTLGIFGSTEPVQSAEDPSISPESALHGLENAYRRSDIEAAVALKDFVSEARLMMAQLGDDTTADQEMLKSVAETLELSFRVDIQENGFPDFSKLECSVVA